jgi:hypothetical protein
LIVLATPVLGLGLIKSNSGVDHQLLPAPHAVQLLRLL